jgi:hypothetical protein
MSDDGPRFRGESLHVGDDEGGVGARDSLPASRWATIESPLPEPECRQRILRALEPRQPHAYGAVMSGSEGRHGFLLRFKSGRKILAGEVELAGWDGGTQLHLAIPAEQDERHLAVLAKWLERVLSPRG